MSLNDYSLTSGGRDYGRLDEYGQPQRQNYGGGQPCESNFRNRDIQGTYQYGPDKSTMQLPPLHLVESNIQPPHSTNSDRLPPISWFLGSAAQPSYRSMQTSNLTDLRSPADFNVPAARSHSGTTSQSQHYPTSESRIREASYPLSEIQRVQEPGSRKCQPSAPSQRSNTKHGGNEHTDFMHNFPTGIPTSIQLSPPLLGRSEIELGNSSSRHAKKEQSRRRHKAKERSRPYSSPYSSHPNASMLPQQQLQGYSECLRYHASVESPQAIRGNSSATEEMPADFDMECRLPGCKERISENALFGACGTHHNQLSTWDFSYCEAEKRDSHDPADYLPNGQCKAKKRKPNKRWCSRHSKQNYHSRSEFLNSGVGILGKWFVGRHQGTANLPPGYGKSGAQSSFDCRSSSKTSA
ncbi:uncharacterized protein EAE97_005960 [Botrytis byssoidea]|uniref:Uncharacterized protein n=1 Tax=Botrytis byssoidea TaxID=139641 RepID=A0A9P5IJT1_9HELO|nr:uncharacterized protein EAE97_005960 [Botrytis byssoidea]KAF7943890.1 hypothetical protein EAE97_005960 [Botrytis byssoidea]